MIRWVGALEVIGKSNDKRPIWDDDFPIRLAVKPLILLNPEHGVPMDALAGRVAFFAGEKDRTHFETLQLGNFET